MGRGRPKKEESDKKLALLQTIKEKKCLLFGQFSSDVDKLKIDRAWEEVLLHAKSLALVSEGRDASYVRKLFSQWKSRTLEKKDNSKRTGTGGGKQNKLNEIDHLVLDIVGKESPVVEGLTVGESGNYRADNDENVEFQDGVLFDEDDLKEFNISTDADAEAVPLSKSNDKVTASSFQFTVQTKKRKLNPPTEKELLLEAKWKAQTELLKQQAYNLMLQNYKLEVELGLPHSDYTSSLNQF